MCLFSVGRSDATASVLITGTAGKRCKEFVMLQQEVFCAAVYHIYLSVMLFQTCVSLCLDNGAISEAQMGCTLPSIRVCLMEKIRQKLF